MRFYANVLIIAVCLAVQAVADKTGDKKDAIVGSSYGGGGGGGYAPAPSYSAPAAPSYSAPSYSAPAAPSYSAPAAPSYSAPSYNTIPSPPCPKNYLFGCRPHLAPVPCSAPSEYGSAGAYSQYAPNYVLPQQVRFGY